MNPKFLINKNENYPEDRLIIVVIHEYGHILYNRKTPKEKRNRIKNEQAAFEYSIEVAIKMTEEKRDYGPLKQVVKNLKNRNEIGKPEDPHTKAIKNLMKEPIWQKAIRISNEG